MHTPSPLAWLTALLLLASLWLLRRSLRSPPPPAAAPDRADPDAADASADPADPLEATHRSPLRAVSLRSSDGSTPPPPRDALDTSWTRMRCTQCRRAFALGTLRCPYDAAPCVREYVFGVPLSALIIKAKVCPSCGAQYDPASSACPCCPTDAPPHLVARVHGKQDLIDIQPVVLCACCHTEQIISSVARCVRCDAPLTPALLVAGRLTAGYPPEGVGPKTQVCPQCGSRCAPNLSFCARDGARLISIN